MNLTRKLEAKLRRYNVNEPNLVFWARLFLVMGHILGHVIRIVSDFSGPAVVKIIQKASSCT